MDHAVASYDQRSFYYVQGTRLCVASADGRERRVFHRGHTGPTYSFALSRDETLVASLSDDALVHVWEVATGELRWTLEGHAHRVTDAGFAPDGRTLWTCDGVEPARAWDLATGMEIDRGDEDWIGHSLEVSPDGAHVLVQVDPTMKRGGWAVTLVHPGTLCRIARIHTGGSQIATVTVTFTDDGRELLVCKEVGEPRQFLLPSAVLRFAIDKGAARLLGETELETRPTPRPDSRWRFDRCSFTRIRGKLRLVVGWHAEPDTRPERERIGPSYRWDFHDVASGRVVGRLPSDSSWVRSLRQIDQTVAGWHLSGERLAVVFRGGPVRLFSITDGALIETIEPTDEEVSFVTLSRDGRALFLGTASGWILRYEAS